MNKIAACRTSALRTNHSAGINREPAAVRFRNSNKTDGDCPDFAESAEQNGTVPLAEAVLLEFLSRILNSLFWNGQGDLTASAKLTMLSRICRRFQKSIPHPCTALLLAELANAHRCCYWSSPGPDTSRCLIGYDTCTNQLLIYRVSQPKMFCLPDDSGHLVPSL